MPQLHCLCSLALHLLTQFILFFFFDKDVYLIKCIPLKKILKKKCFCTSLALCVPIQVLDRWIGEHQLSQTKQLG